MKIDKYMFPGIGLGFAAAISLQAQAATFVDDFVAVLDTNNGITSLLLDNGINSPEQNWEISNNNFGLNELAIVNATSGLRPFWIDPAAPSDALIIGQTGINLGTTSGFANLNIASGTFANIGLGANDGGDSSLYFLNADVGSFSLVDFSQFDGNFDTLLTPLVLQEGAPDNSLFVNNQGNVGVGTSTPGGPLGSNLTVSNPGAGIVPSSIFLDDGVNGWSIGASDGLGAFIANDFSAYLNIATNGNVGMSPGVAPEARLHVGGSNDAKILVKNWDAGTGTQVMFNLVNDGGVRFDMLDNSTGSNWVFQNQFGSFDVTLAGTGTREFRFYPNGNLEIAGSYLQASSRAIKHDIEPVDAMSILEKVASLPINRWSYNREEGVRHMGPMSEDFYTSFGLGGTDKGITTVDAGGVALAAIQGLKQEKDQQLAERDAQLAKITAEKDKEIAELQERMIQLEMALSEVLRNYSSEAHIGSIN